MSPVQRPLSGSPLSFRLEEELRTVRAQLADGSLASHSADGPITVHVLDGAIEFEAEGSRWPLPVGTLFSLDAGVVHAVHAPQGGIFLLTMAAPPAE